MADIVTKRLNKVLTELNISMDRAVEYLSKKGIDIKADPNSKIEAQVYEVLVQGFEQDKSKKQQIEEVNQAKRDEKEKQRIAKEAQLAAEAALQAAKEKAAVEVITAKAQVSSPNIIGKIDLEALHRPAKKEAPKVDRPASAKAPEKPKAAPAPSKAPAPAQAKAPEKSKVAPPATVPVAPKVDIAPTTPESTKIETKYSQLEGVKTVGTIDLSQFDKPKPDPKKAQANAATAAANNKRKRKRGEKVSATGGATQPQGQNSQPRQGGQQGQGQSRGPGARNNQRPVLPKVERVEPTEAEISKQIKETLDKLTSKSSKSRGSKYRKEKRISRRDQADIAAHNEELESKILKATEYVTVSELATMMNVSVTQVISSCMMLGIMASMNQRLDAETLSVIADEFGFEIEFVDAALEESVQDTSDAEEDLSPRAPIVTVMGHVDHGKTSLLDYVRRANVIAGEAGGITQHIAAYSVKLDAGNQITFLDTPGHEAFTAMRARGAQVTDIAIIVIAADSDVMPQTKEAISHAQAAGVPMIIAINKVDLPTANPDKIRESLSQLNILVEDWGGKVQCQEISAKKGIGINELLEKVLLEAEMLELKANPDKNASGTIIEASLDKGKGYVATILVQNGTLKIGDYMLAGHYSGKVKAMFDERGNKITTALPARPVLVLGLDGSPQAGDKFNVFSEEKEAKQIAARRAQLKREQNVRTSKHITLDEIGRRIAIGDFKELNIIVKGDVDGSVEALTDSLQNLSTGKIHINIIHRAVGQITESDVLLASASEAIIIGFNVRPSTNAKRLAEQEEIDIRNYSIIYDAINEVKDAMEGMLAPVFKEEVVGNIEIRQVFKISKIGTIAGCMVLDGKVSRNTKIRLIRDGVVLHTGHLASLKRFKDDVKEVSKGYECGLNIDKFNDIREGDIIEGYQMVEVKPKL